MARVKYNEMVSDIERRISHGKLQNDDKLPTESELSSTYGVSRQTVRNGLSKLIKKGLLKSIQGSGYYVIGGMPPQKAKRHIAVITTYISDYIFPAILRRIESTLSDQGYVISLYATNNSVVNERNVLKSLDTALIGGIIVEGTQATFPNPNISIYTELAEAGTKIVFFNSIYSGLNHPNIKSVMMDDRAGGAYLAEKLIMAGHTAIGTLMKIDDRQGVNRYAGIVDALFTHSLSLNENNILMFTTMNHFLDGDTEDYTYLRTLDVIRNCTAIICYNDITATHLVDMLAKAEGSQVTAVYSFDNYNHIIPLPGVDFFSLGYPREIMGNIISEKLLHMIEGCHEQSEAIPWIIS